MRLVVVTSRRRKERNKRRGFSAISHDEETIEMLSQMQKIDSDVKKGRDTEIMMQWGKKRGVKEREITLEIRERRGMRYERDRREGRDWRDWRRITKLR